VRKIEVSSIKRRFVEFDEQLLKIHLQKFDKLCKITKICEKEFQTSEK